MFDKETSDPLTVFFYLLMRNTVVCGEIEKIVQEVEMDIGDSHRLSNGYLAGYAADVASRLRR